MIHMYVYTNRKSWCGALLCGAVWCGAVWCGEYLVRFNDFSGFNDGCMICHARWMTFHDL